MFRRPSRLTLICVSLLILAAAIAWRTGWLEQWSEGLYLRRIVDRRIEAVINDLRPKLPFEIVSWGYDSKFGDLRRGRISEVRVELRRAPYTLKLRGPLEIDWISSGKSWVAVYRPTLESLGPWTLTSATAEISAAASTALDRLIRIGLRTEMASIALPELGLEADAPKIEGGWNDETLFTQFDAKAVRFADPADPQRAGEVTGLAWSSESELLLQSDPSREPLGPGTATLGFASGALAWEDLYFERASPLLIQIEGDPRTKKAQAKTEIGSRAQTLSLQEDRVAWKLDRLPLADLWKGLEGVPAAAALSRAWTLRAGTLTSTGSSAWPPSLETLDGELSLQNLHAENVARTLAAKGLSLTLPLGERSLTRRNVRLAIERGYFQRLGFRLNPVEFQIRRSAHEWRIDSLRDIPVSFDGFTLTISRAKGSIGSSESMVTTGALTEGVSIESFRAGLCLEGKPLPPARLAVRFPVIEITSKMIDLQGTFEAALFGGKVELKDLAIYHYLSETPETDFSSQWSGLRLDQLGEWAGFGQMDGVLQGHANHVTLIGTNPTHFDFRVEAKPYRKGDIVFSPEAMRNTVQLFAAEQMDELPGIAQWLAFGWLSRVFGGYDIDYAGISVYSHEGSILVETLDPPEFFAKEQKRYILYGKRFRMPLQSFRYPLVIDASAMGNFVRHVKSQIEALAQAKNASASESTTQGRPSNEPAQKPDPSCLVPENF